MFLVLAAIGVLVLSGLGALSCGRAARWATLLGVGGAVAGSALGLAGAVPALLSGAAPVSLRLDWAVPGGSFAVALDPLSSFFLIPTFVLAALAAIYGAGYLAAAGRDRSLGPAWLFFNTLVASMVLVLLARNGVLFLMAWEVMSVASFFLVTFEDEHAENRQAGWTYLIATHCGTACLLALFAILGRSSGSLDFAAFAGSTGPALPGGGLLFLLALVGFGTKAGLMPLHVWLPEAHPAAPTHVSALMSGAMIKLGIYGLLRALGFLGPPAVWWGWVLIAIGLGSGILGALLALAQRDLKRILAYSSVENVGIIAVGLGAGVLGAASDAPALAVLGFGGALLHALNHAAVKGLLFFGAGAVAHATGTRDIERLGGLLARMPRTGLGFLVGAAAIAGLPPLGGFAGEFLILLGAFGASATSPATLAVPLLGTIAGLALIGGLTLFGFARAFGIAFLGRSRGAQAEAAHDPGPAMRLPMSLLAAAALLIGLLAPALAGGLAPVVSGLAGLDGEAARATLSGAARILRLVVLAGVGLGGWLVVLALLRRRLTAGRSIEAAPTWDCGYARPTARMQYSASSFAQPLTALFAPVLRTRHSLSGLRGVFPTAAALETAAPDPAREALFAPAFSALRRHLSGVRRLQQGRVQVYVLYIVLTLLVLLLWQFGLGQ